MFSTIHDILNITYYIICMIPINLYLLHVSIQRLEKEMATHSSILAWKNPKDRGAWWATGHEVAKSRTQLSD